MAEHSGVPPLPRRVPGAADSPKPPADVKTPVLSESLLERLRAATEAAREREVLARRSASGQKRRALTAASAQEGRAWTRACGRPLTPAVRSTA
jgi:hypothetical protein